MKELVREITEANNLAEIRKAYGSVTNTEGLQSQQAFLLMETLYSKSMGIAEKALKECEEHKAKIRALTPMPVEPDLAKEIRKEMMEQSPQFIRKTLMEAPFDSRNLGRYKAAMIALAERLESVITKAQIHSQTSTGDTVAMIRLEAERNALVEAIRIMASQGKYDPNAQEGESGV